MKKENSVGLYIVLEGVDFSGKSTIAKELVKLLSEKYGDYNVVHKREPSYENYGAKMREVLTSGKMTEEKEILAAQYMLLDRLENTSNVSELLRENKIVIQERNFLTALVYNEAGDTKEVKFIQEANKLSLKPDHLVLITMSDSTMRHRIDKAIEERGFVDEYENYDKISARKKAYYMFDEYINQTMVNDNSDSFNNILNSLMKYVDNNYSLLLNQAGHDSNNRGIK